MATRELWAGVYEARHIIDSARMIRSRYGGEYPELKTVATERLIARGSWAALMGARSWDVRYVRFFRHGRTPIIHLSPYSQPHPDEDGYPRTDVLTLCGRPIPVAGDASFVINRPAPAAVCPECRALAVKQGLVIMDELFVGGER